MDVSSAANLLLLLFSPQQRHGRPGTMSWWAEGWAQSDLTGRLLLKLTQLSLGIQVSLDENRANFRASEMVLALPHPPPHILVAFKPFLQSSVQRVPGGDCPGLPILLLDAPGGGVELP